MEAVVLAGGKGTRLSSVVADRPKPMAIVAGRAFVEWVLLGLRAQGVQRFVFCTGHLAEAVEGHFGDGSHWGVEIAYSREHAPLGTGGALRNALSQMRSDRLLVVNGDSYCQLDASRLVSAHRSAGAGTTLWLVPAEDSSRYGSVSVAADGRILSFKEKTLDAGPGLVSAGIYLMDRVVIEAIPPGRQFSIENDLFPSMIGRGLYGVVGSGSFIDIGTPDSYSFAEHFPAWEALRAAGGHRNGRPTAITRTGVATR